MSYMTSPADQLIQTMRFIRHELTAEELNAIDDVLVKALQRLGRKVGDDMGGGEDNAR